ncbi:hypothetical protein H0H93_007242 [Arthromyces matolae]|nr:hypothetical protein H0H93_007242 [Arthromyces matolae]
MPTYTLRYGTRAAAQPSSYTGMLKAIATSAYQGVMISNNVVMSFALHQIPFVWVHRGLSLSRRIQHLEERWAYYFAFGLPSALLCTCGTGLANVVLFALVYPAYIILATVAHPVPSDPYNPLSPTDDSPVTRHPSPFVPIRLPIFALVMWLNNTIVRILSVGSPRKHSGHTRSLSDTTDAVEEGKPIELKAVPPPAERTNRGRINIGRRKLD